MDQTDKIVHSELGDGVIVTATKPLTKEDHRKNIEKLRAIIDEKNAIQAQKREE
jgi:hypothetical protein